MSQEKEPQQDQDEQQDNDKEYIPASPVKRALAWIALVYVLIFLVLTTYYYYTGSMLGNLGPLLTVPGLIGLGAVITIQRKTTGAPGRTFTVVFTLACWVLAAFTLPIGIAGLLSNFRG